MLWNGPCILQRISNLKHLADGAMLQIEYGLLHSARICVGTSTAIVVIRAGGGGGGVGGSRFTKCLYIHQKKEY